MPRVQFTEENIKKNAFDYPKLKMDKKGEVARIVLLEDPVMEYVHNIQKPKLNGGQAVMEIKSRKDGTQYEDNKYEFVSRPICLGDYATLEAQGSDPERCPICREATRSDKFKGPVRRFALHVVKYETQPGKNVVKEPFQATTVIWSFTDRVFEQLFALKQEWGDLRSHDLTLTCTNPAFQNYDIAVAKDAEWLKGEDRKALVKGLMQPENLAEDLAVFCGSKKAEANIAYDIKAVNEAWAVINGTNASPNDAALAGVGSGSLTAGLDDLLDQGGSASSETTTEDAWAKNPAADEEVKAASKPKESPAVSTSELDDLLGGL